MFEWVRFLREFTAKINDIYAVCVFIAKQISFNVFEQVSDFSVID